MAHPLHEIIGRCIKSNKFPNCKIKKDAACGGEYSVPLFCSRRKANGTRYCDVDLLMIKNNRIKVIIEIEESSLTPNQICGKFLTSALSSYYIHESENNTPIGMGDSVLFIQILDPAKTKVNGAKTTQWINLEKSIKSILPIGGVREYRLIYKYDCSDLISCIKKALTE